MRPFPRLPLVALALCVLPAGPALAASTAFRLTDLDLRDPHLYIIVAGTCFDVTDAPAGSSANDAVQNAITGDADMDGRLDLSYTIVFDPLDQAGPGGTLRFGPTICTAPMATTTCTVVTPLQPLTYVNQAAGTCLAPVAGTTYDPYTPEIATPGSPCFVTDPATINFYILDAPVTLHNARLAGTYSGAPATALQNGLILGFLLEADANNIILSAGWGPAAGQPLSSVLPGGDRPPAGGSDQNCATHSDKDLLDGVPGWWVYWNFPASAVPFNDATAGVDELARLGVSLSAVPNPARGSMSFEYALGVQSFVRLSVHDLQGRLVTDLVRASRPPGRYTATWDGRASDGSALDAGVYFASIQVLGRTLTERVVLFR